MWRSWNVVALGVMAMAYSIPAARGDAAAPEEEPLNVFTGRVVDSSGDAVAEASIYAFHAEEAQVWYSGPESVRVYAQSEKAWLFFPKRNGLRSAEVTTDRAGRFTAYGLVPGPYRVLVVHAKRGATVSPTLRQPNPDAPATVTLEPPTFLKGQIKGLDTAPRQETPLYSRMWKAVWDNPADSEHFLRLWTHPEIDIQPDGTFAVGPLPAGGDFTFQLNRFVKARGFSVDLLKRNITIHQGKTTDLVIDLSRGETLSGLVVGPEGKPLDSVAVTIQPQENAKDLPWSSLGTLTDGEGRFALAGLSPGTYQLAANRWLRRTGFG